MAKKPGSPNPLAAHWPMVVDLLLKQIEAGEELSPTKVVDLLVAAKKLETPNTKTDARNIARFVETIKTYCRGHSPSEFVTQLTTGNTKCQWQLSGDYLVKAAALAATILQGTTHSLATALRVAHVIRRPPSATICVGVRWPDGNNARDLIERCDFKSYATLVSKLHSQNPAIEVQPFDVGATSVEFLEDLLVDSLAGQDLLIFVGSARSNRLSNLAVAKMYGHNATDAFNAMGSTNPRDLPFHFCWNTTKDPGYYASQMELPLDKVTNGTIRNAVRTTGCYAFEYNGHEELVAHKNLGSTDYGVILAQRRGVQTWVVLMGCSGTATRACCDMLFREDQLDLPVPEVSEGVLCIPIECDVERVCSTPGLFLADNRSYSSPRRYVPSGLGRLAQQ